jgi:tetratricopeptide (TPR) repeat protein
MQFYNKLSWLEGKDWAKNPLEFYLDYLKKNKPEKEDAIFDIECLLKIGQGESEKTFENYLDKGVAYYNNKDYYKAIVAFSEYLKDDPYNLFILNRQGIAYGKLQKYDLAMNSFSFALSIDNTFGKAYHNRGIIYWNQKHYEKAIEDITKSLEYEPYNQLRLNNRGLLFNIMEKYNEAIEDFTKSINIESGDKDKEKIALLGRTEAYECIGEIKKANKYRQNA